MGNTCAPDNAEDDGQVNDVEAKEVEEAEPSEKFTNIINTYQAENETLRQELETMRTQDEEDSKARSEQAEKNDELLKELAAMKERLEVKDRALVKHQLEAALHSKATSMVNDNAAAKLIKVGSIEKFKKAGKSKKASKWVEIYFHGGSATETGITKGQLVMTFADSKDSQVANRCQLLRLDEKVDVKTKTFSVDVNLSGRENTLVFACEDEKETETWVQAIDEGFKQIEEEVSMLKTVNEYTILEVVFTKEKLGIRVEEKIVEVEEVKSTEEAKSGDYKGAEVAAAEDEDKPCELTVTHISDEDLHVTGLTVDFTVSAINGISLRGKTYQEQVDHLSKTKKPFTLTFLKKKNVKQAAYPRILEQLVADDENAVKSAFFELVQGTAFGKELDESENKTATIAELLANQRRLNALLQNTRIQEAEL